MKYQNINMSMVSKEIRDFAKTLRLRGHSMLITYVPEWDIAFIPYEGYIVITNNKLSCEYWVFNEYFNKYNFQTVYVF